MKKLLFTVLLTLAVVACGQKKEEVKAEATPAVVEEVKTETAPAVAEETKKEVSTLKFESTDGGAAKFNSTITSEDNFESAKLTYSIDGGEEKTVDLKAFPAASGIGVQSEDGKIEFMFKAEEGIATIDGVDYSVREVK